MKEQNRDTDLQNLKVPQFENESHKQQLKITLLNARRSSRIGILLILIPCIFILGIVIKYGFGIDIPGFTAAEDLLARLDRSSSFQFITPLILAVAPAVALVINLVAITHFQRSRESKQLIITVKLKTINILIILACLLILGALLLHMVAEGTHPA